MSNPASWWLNLMKGKQFVASSFGSVEKEKFTNPMSLSAWISELPNLP
jgi:hypothetical protein